MSRELKEALDILEKEKSISKDTLLEAIEQSLIQACKNHFGKADNVHVTIDPETCDFSVYADRSIVEYVEDPAMEISLADALKITSRAEIGGMIQVPIQSKEFGRIATQNAKNVILQKIREEERKVLYDEYYGKGQYKFKLKLDLEMMKEELGDEYVILLRTHHYIADALDVTGVEDFAYNLSKYDDITEIYLISDICITDYSSVFFDYANLKRPMLFYTYDIDKYRDVLRGFYIDMEKELPGPLVYSTKEVIDQIKHLDEMNQKYAQRYEVFYDKFCSIDDGNASQRAVEAVFK